MFFLFGFVFGMGILIELFFLLYVDEIDGDFVYTRINRLGCKNGIACVGVLVMIWCFWIMVLRLFLSLIYLLMLFLLWIFIVFWFFCILIIFVFRFGNARSFWNCVNDDWMSDFGLVFLMCIRFKIIV